MDYDDTPLYRFSTDGQKVWVNSNLLQVADPLNLTSSLTGYDLQIPYSDTMIATTERLMALRSIYAITPDSLHLLGAIGGRYFMGPIALNDRLALVADMPGEDSGKRITIYDISQRAEPKPVSSIAMPNIESIELRDRAAYVSDGNNLITIDLSDLANPRITETLALRGIRCMTSLDKLLIVTQWNGVVQFDISDPVHPKRIAAVV